MKLAGMSLSFFRCVYVLGFCPAKKTLSEKDKIARNERNRGLFFQSQWKIRH